jgi:hypothetical protein
LYHHYTQFDITNDVKILTIGYNILNVFLGILYLLDYFQIYSHVRFIYYKHCGIKVLKIYENLRIKHHFNHVN